MKDHLKNLPLYVEDSNFFCMASLVVLENNIKKSIKLIK